MGPPPAPSAGPGSRPASGGRHPPGRGGIRRPAAPAARPPTCSAPRGCTSSSPGLSRLPTAPNTRPAPSSRAPWTPTLGSCQPGHRGAEARPTPRGPRPGEGARRTEAPGAPGPAARTPCHAPQARHTGPAAPWLPCALDVASCCLGTSRPQISTPSSGSPLFARTLPGCRATHSQEASRPRSL